MYTPSDSANPHRQTATKDTEFYEASHPFPPHPSIHPIEEKGRDQLFRKLAIYTNAHASHFAFTPLQSPIGVESRTLNTFSCWNIRYIS
jgi:hypothetical protein